MNTPLLGTSLSLLLSLTSLSLADTGARVYCWAPHLGSSTILLDSHGMGVGSYAGRPYSYKIFGVAGSLALGDQCDGAFADSSDPDRSFRQGWWSGSLGAPVDIFSSVELQVNWAQYYPERLEVTGPNPGSSSGPVRLYGETWEITKKFGYPEVTLVFHLAGSGDSAIPNRNPNGFFYVIGEYLTSPPVTTGTLTVSKDSILRGNITPVGFNINRTGADQTTPPFTGYDQSGEVVFLSE